MPGYNLNGIDCSNMLVMRKDSIDTGRIHEQKTCLSTDGARYEAADRQAGYCIYQCACVSDIRTHCHSSRTCRGASSICQRNGGTLPSLERMAGGEERSDNAHEPSMYIQILFQTGEDTAKWNEFTDLASKKQVVLVIHSNPIRVMLPSPFQALKKG